jgi:hypothetical protein
VITVEPSLINTDDLYFSNDEYIYFYIRNHGLIAAKSGNLVLPTNIPSMILTAEVNPIGDIPGKEHFGMIYLLRIYLL